MSEVNKQLIDDGAVIGYRPDLYLSKTIDANVSDVATGNSGSASDNFSTTLISFLENMPADTIGSIDLSINNIDAVINRLKELFKQSYTSEYSNIEMFLESLDLDNTEYAEKFLSYHMDNIQGNSIPELCYILKTEQHRLQELSNTLKKLYYGGDSVSSEYMKEQDDSYRRLLSQYEASDPGKINYLSVISDSILNRSIVTFTTSINSTVCDLEDVIYRTDVTKSGNRELENTLSTLFDDITQQVKDRNTSYNMQQGIDTMVKTLYNYYDKRKNMLNFYNLAVASGSENGYLVTKIGLYDKQLENAILNVNKTLSGNSYHLQKIKDLEIEKQYLRSIYNTISYN